ncbi:MAG: DeoR/GlpR transcriptional regulator [Balneolaceae bacterium]|nr:DeoR/GlpR transcriptional regulator [Balneolaceae bacterium]
MISTVDRRYLIQELLLKEKIVWVTNLSRRLNVSSVTIRNDLGFLEKIGFVQRTRGGAQIRNNNFIISTQKRKNIFTSKSSNRIGEKAFEMITDGDHVFLDSYADFMSIDQFITRKKNLFVMTNSLNIAFNLRNCENLTLMLTGGTINKESGFLFGPEAEDAINNFYFDKLILGIDGLDTKYGLTLSNPLEAQLNKIMLQRAKNIIVIATSNIFGRRELSPVCSIDDINTIITDQISSQFENQISRKNVKVIKA